MSSDVRSYIRGCRSCQKNKAVTHKRYGMAQPLEVPNRRWKHISMDFIPDLPRTVNGFNSIFVVVDKYSKRAHFIPVKTTYTIGQFAEMFYKEVFRHHGMPRKIISDRDPLWISNFWRHLCRKIGARIAMSTPHSPQTDGQTERTNRTLEEMIRCFVENKHKNWDKFLVAAEFAYNNTVHSAHGYTPFYLDMGQHPRDPHANAYAELMDSQVTVDGASEVPEPVNYSTAAEKFLAEWRDAESFAHVCLKEARENMREIHARPKEPEFKAGDLVWLDTKHIKLPDESGNLSSRTKFSALREGPYVIDTVLPGARACKLVLRQGDQFHHTQPVSRLEPVRDSEAFPDAHVRYPPAPIQVDGEVEYEIDHIVSHKFDDKTGRRTYKVRWKGYGPEEDTEMSLARLRNAAELVAEYHAKIGISFFTPTVKTVHFSV